MVAATGGHITSILPAGTATTVNSTTPFTWASGDVINLTAVIPIAEYNGGINLAASISPAALGADVNDYNPTGLLTTNYVRMDAGAGNRNITGLTAPSSGSTVLTLVNVGASNNLVLKHQNAGSAAGNRFISSTGADITLTPEQQATVWYDRTTLRWRIDP
jgi:hypothetical protein